MPRLTAQDYLAHRRLLIEEWFEHDAFAFGEVSLSGQHGVHDYYAPTESFSDAEALSHRAAMTKAFPSLPQKAGRALQVLVTIRDRKAPRVVEARTPPPETGR